MSSDNEHLVDWVENEHETSPSQTGCLWRHEEYEGTKFPRCNYRKNAHDYSKASEKGVYNVPNMRSPERWVQVWVDRLLPSLQKVKTTNDKGRKVPLKNSADDFVMTPTPGRGRDGPSPHRLGPPPAQIPAGAANALGSCRGC